MLRWLLSCILGWWQATSRIHVAHNCQTLHLLLNYNHGGQNSILHLVKGIVTLSTTVIKDIRINSFQTFKTLWTAFTKGRGQWIDGLCSGVGKVTLSECYIGNNLANIHMEIWDFGNNIKVLFTQSKNLSPSAQKLFKFHQCSPKM